MNSNTSVRKNSNDLESILEDVMNSWLCDNSEYIIQIYGGEWLRLTDYHDVLKETYDEEDDRWDSDVLITCVESHEIADGYLYLVCPSGTTDLVLRISLDDIMVIQDEEGNETAF